MDINEANKKVENLPEYLHRGQYQREDEINHRVLERTVPDSPLPPNFTPRPVLTKYTLFPMLDSRMPSNTPIESNFNYSLSNNFTPPLMKNGPVSGFINNVQLESDLRNQTFALNCGNDKTTYVPSSESDLYKVYIPSAPSNQPHPDLFSRPVLNQQVHPNVQNAPHVGNDRFHNSTRVQLKQPL